MRVLIAFFVIALTAGAVGGESLWVNDITVNEYDMTWSYNDTFVGNDSTAFRVYLDSNYGDNNSFVNAWEVLKADKELRKEFRSLIDKELDVRINNMTGGIEIVDVDATLSTDLIGKTNLSDTITNRYITTYRFRDSILNARSIWFLGQANSTVTIVMPQGVDVANIGGMGNVTMIVTDHAEISGFFRETSEDRGEITLVLARNSSFVRAGVNMSNISNVSSQPGKNESAKPMFEMLNFIRDASIVVVGLVLIILIYVLKVKRR
ncbi:MAG: hypothetical protein Q8M95_08640 [Candidatus Methanoperedens sp.]|nr:hypothetical protein [Candidatus Methanoperedens sp.]